MTKKILLKRMEADKVEQGITWGVPWGKGKLKEFSNFVLKDEDNNFLKTQSWPTAFWPDGSIKWTAHSAYFAEGVKEKYYLVKKSDPLKKQQKEKNYERKNGIRVKKFSNCIEVKNNKIRIIFNKQGKNIIKEFYSEEKLLVRAGSLECIVEKDEGNYSFKKYYQSKINSVEVEAEGKIRTVIKVEGKHQNKKEERNWLPFKIRFYFYANSADIRVKNSYIFDGNPEKDYIKKLAFVLKVPLKDELQNRNLRFAGEKGIFSESVRLLPALHLNKYLDLYKKQIAGEKINLNKHKELIPYYQDMPIWSDYQISQDTANHFSIQKRTKKGCSWVKAAEGRCSKGLAYLSSGSGGIVFGLRDFWQKHPSQLELNDLAKKEAEVKISFWGGGNKKMDLRHYDNEPHVKSSYEGFDELRATPVGIANSSEFNLRALDHNPGNQELLELAELKDKTQLLVCQSDYYHQTGVFAGWSKKEKSSSIRVKIEKILSAAFNFYRDEVESRNWYGFWNYGDVMHSYDHIRHNWRYDMGGYAWQNAELVPNMWLWYSFLRTGNKEIFRMAENMTVHTSEVDTYHLGEFAGLGSRHNVVHWGCGCKEARISMAGLHRFYYYLTADERTGEIIDQTKDADYMTEKLNPMREHIEDDNYPTYVRSGPDWIAFVSNWLSQWERYQDQVYKDKILKGINSLKEMPFGLCSGPAFGYRADCGELYYIGDENYSYHMVMPFGGLQIFINLLNIIQDQKLEKLLIEFGQFYYLSEQEKARLTDGKLKGDDWAQTMLNAGIAAFAADKLDDNKLLIKSWRMLLENNSDILKSLFLNNNELEKKVDFIKEIREIKGISTNFISQWSLNVIFALNLVNDSQLKTIASELDTEKIDFLFGK